MQYKVEKNYWKTESKKIVTKIDSLIKRIKAEEEERNIIGSRINLFGTTYTIPEYAYDTSWMTDWERNRICLTYSLDKHLLNPELYDMGSIYSDTILEVRNEFKRMLNYINEPEIFIAASSKDLLYRLGCMRKIAINYANSEERALKTMFGIYPIVQMLVKNKRKNLSDLHKEPQKTTTLSLISKNKSETPC